MTINELIGNVTFLNITLALVETSLQIREDRHGGLMVSVYASSAEGSGFDPRSGQTKDIKIGIFCFSA